MTQSSLLSINVCQELEISPLQMKRLSVSQADLDPTFGQELFFGFCSSSDFFWHLIFILANGIEIFSGGIALNNIYIYSICW